MAFEDRFVNAAAFAPAAASALPELERDGLAIISEPFLTAAGVDFVRNALLRMMDERHPEVGVGEIVSPYQRPGGEWMWQLATHPAILDVVEAQVGGDILLWSGGPGCKAPLAEGAAAEDNGFVPWHQDSPYWNVHPAKHAAAIWLAVSEVDEANGTMSVLPHNYHRGILPRIIDHAKLEANTSSGKPVFSDAIDPRALPAEPHAEAHAYTLRAGEMGLHDVLSPHSARPNTDSERWRLVLVFRYVSAAGDFGQKEYTDFRSGERFPREYFLVRGEDRAKRGFRRSPWEGDGAGYVGEESVDLAPHAEAEAETRRSFGWSDDGAKL